MGCTTLHAGILAQWFEILLRLLLLFVLFVFCLFCFLVFFLKIRYVGRQWDFISCNATWYYHDH